MVEPIGSRLPDDIPTLGRERELELLRGVLRRAGERSGALALVSGEAGIGKTHLVAAFAGEAAAEGVAVHWGRAWEAGGAPPYWPWVQAMRSIVASAQDAERLARASGGAISQLLPELRRQIPDLAEAPSADEEGARFHLFDSVVRLLRAASEAGTMLVILEDLHVADVPSVLLLDFVAAQLPGVRLVVVGTWRGEDLEPGHPILAAITAASRNPAATRLPLAGLSDEAVARYVRFVAGTAPTEALVARVARESEGNPLFAGELVRLMDAEGRLGSQSAAGRIGVPETIRELIGRRVARLSPAEQEILEVAAIAGRDFEPLLVAEVAGIGTVEVVERLEGARREHLITDAVDDVGRLRFTHALIRDSIDIGLPAVRRAWLHGEIAATLERIHRADLDPHLAEIAHHLLAGPPEQQPGRAAAYALRAGAAALGYLAYEEAARVLELGIPAASRAGDVRLQCELLLGLGEAFARSGDSRSRATFLEAAVLARRHGHADQLARAALGYGGRFVWEASRGDETLVDLLQTSLDQLPAGDSILRVRVTSRLAAGPYRDDPDRSLRDRLSLEAVEMAARIGDPPTLAYALDGRYAAAWWPENAEERVRTATALIDAATRAGDRERTLQGHHYRGLARLELADVDGAHEDAAAQARIARELRQPAQSHYVRTVEAMLAALAGRFAEAERLVEEAHDLGIRAALPMAPIYRTMLRAAIRRHVGGIEEVIPELRALGRRLPSYVVLRCVLTDAERIAGDESAARRRFRALASDGYAAIPRNDEWIFALCNLGEVAAAVGDEEQVADLLELLAPYSDRVAVSAPDACHGSVARVLALLEERMGRQDEALARLEAAATLEDHLGAPAWLAETRLAQSRLLLRDGREADRGRRLLSDVEATAASLGLIGLAARAAELRASDAGPGVRRSVTFLFTDVAGSTELVSAIGDEAWVELRAWHDRQLRDAFDRHGGREVDHAGDGFFVAFETVEAAVRAAVAIQRRLRDHRRSSGFAPSVRIGIHAGEAIEEGPTRYSGRAVHEAARIGGLAGPGEILATASSLAGLEVSHGARRTVVLKGIAESVDVVSVDWSGSAASQEAT